MGWIVHKQPDGKFKIWSSIVDCYVERDLDRRGVQEEFAQRDAELREKRVDGAMDRAETVRREDEEEST